MPRKPLALVTGGGGYFGFRLGRRLAAEGYDVRLFDVRPPALQPSGPSAPGGGGALHVLVGEVRDLAQVEAACEGVDVVFHAASYGMSGREMLNKQLIYEVNVRGTSNVIAACISCSVRRLVYTSTYNVVFGGQRIDGGDEAMPYWPLNRHPDNYAPTKALAEQQVLAANGRAVAGGGVLRTCAVRAAGIMGPGEQRHLPRIVSYIEGGLLLFVYGSPHSKVDFIHVDNLMQGHVLVAVVLMPARFMSDIADTVLPFSQVQGHVLAAEGLGEAKGHVAAGQAYFMSDGRPVNNFEYFRPLIEGLGYSFPRVRLPVLLIYLLAYMCEVVHAAVSRLYNFQPLLTRAEVFKTGVHHWFRIDKARRELGYQPEDYGSREIVEWFLDRGHGRVSGRRAAARGHLDTVRGQTDGHADTIRGQKDGKLPSHHGGSVVSASSSLWSWATAAVLVVLAVLLAMPAGLAEGRHAPLGAQP